MQGCREKWKSVKVLHKVNWAHDEVQIEMQRPYHNCEVKLRSGPRSLGNYGLERKITAVILHVTAVTCPPQAQFTP